MPEPIRYERDVSRGEWFVEQTEAGTTFSLPPPPIWPLGCTVVGAAGMLALISLDYGVRPRGSVWALVIVYGVMISFATLLFFRQRTLRQVVEVGVDGVRFSSSVGGRPRGGWFIAWAEVEAVEIVHVRKVGDLLELRGSGTKRQINGGSMTIEQLETIRDTIEAGRAKFRSNPLESS